MPYSESTKQTIDGIVPRPWLCMVIMAGLLAMSMHSIHERLNAPQRGQSELSVVEIGIWATINVVIALVGISLAGEAILATRSLRHGDRPNGRPAAFSWFSTSPERSTETRSPLRASIVRTALRRALWCAIGACGLYWILVIATMTLIPASEKIPEWARAVRESGIRRTFLAVSCAALLPLWWRRERHRRRA